MLSQVAGVVVIYALSSLVSGNVVTDFCGGYTASDFVNDLIDGNVFSVSNVVYTGACSASGSITFDDDINYVGYVSGIGTKALVLSSGDLNTAASSINSGPGKSFGHNTPGDSDLDALVSGDTKDAAVIEFDVVSPVSVGVSFTYIFASEEYPEFVGSNYNDVFAFWLNDVNVALIDTTVVSINNVNGGSLSQYFVDNEGGSLATEYDGLTVKLETAMVILQANDVVHVKLAIADVADIALDSAVFIEPQSFKIVPATECPSGGNEWSADADCLPCQKCCQGTGLCHPRSMARLL